jgi:hypothetical protein
MKQLKDKKCISIFVIVSLLCFTFLSSLQLSNKMDEAVSMQFDIIHGTISLLKTTLLYPYMSAFVEMENFMNKTKTAPNKNSQKKKANPVPGNNSAANNLFKQLYYILSTILIINHKMLLLMMFAAISMSFVLNKKHNEEFRISRLLSQIEFYRDWCLKFISPKEKYLKDLVKKFNIEDIVGVTGKETRTLKYNSEYGFFLCVKGGIHE